MGKVTIPERLKVLTPEQFEKWFEKYIKPRHKDLDWSDEYKKIGGKLPKPEKKK